MRAMGQNGKANLFLKITFIVLQFLFLVSGCARW